MSGSISRNKVLSNLLFVAALLLFYELLLANALQFPCRPRWVSYAAVVLGFEALIQIFGKPIRQDIDQRPTGQEENDNIVLNLPLIQIPVRRTYLVMVWNNLYLNWSRRKTIPIFVFGVLLISLGLLFSSVKETSPIVLDFTAQLIDHPILPGNVIPVTDSMFISARVDGTCAEPCQWQSVHGKVEPRAGCSVYYSPPINGEKDALTVIVTSLCRTTQTQSTIFVTSVQ